LAESTAEPSIDSDGKVRIRVRAQPLAPRLSEAERAAHREFIATLGEAAVWRNYL
jgi:DNA polymerase-3 subunit epsilon